MARGDFALWLALDASNVGVVECRCGSGIGDVNSRTDGSSQSVVAEAVLPNAVLNADDPLVPQWQKREKSQVAYFTMNLENQRANHTAGRFGGGV